jgi:hypothetical protein
MAETLTFKELQELTGYSRAGDVARCLKKWGVRPLYGKDGPCTTLRALHLAQGVDNTEKKTVEPLDF